jgi:hypothetical protein
MKEKLEQYVNRVKELYETCRDNEAATKAALILPLFTILGYDVADPRECKPEYKADFGEGRSKDPVDWAFSVNNSFVFLVEAKAVGKKIDRYDAQLGDYYAQGQGAVKLGILTNGVQWRFFTDLVAENLMDKEPFLEWDVLKDAIPCDFLTILQRAEFKPELIKFFAKGKRRQSVLVAELTRLLEPSDEFVKLAIQNKETLFENRNLTATVIKEWKPILAGAIREWVQQQSLKMALDRAIDTPVVDPPPSPEDENYIEFWKPIRTEINGLFVGKPADRPWVSKWIRGICLSLGVLNHACYVELGFDDERRRERRDKALELFPVAVYPRELHESPKCVSIRFGVLDKGIKNPGQWSTVREKLTRLGTDVYNKLSDSDV